MSTVINLGVFFLICSIVLAILWYLWYAHKMNKGTVLREEIKAAYFLKRMRLEIEDKEIDFDEMMREYHEETRLFRRREDNRGILEAIDEEVKGEIEKNDKKGKK